MNQSDVKQIVGHKIRELRLKRNLTQRQLATGIMTVAALSMIENGKNKPTAQNLTQLAHRLGVSSSDLIGDPEDLDFNLDVIKMYVRARNYVGVLTLVDQLSMKGLGDQDAVLLAIYKAEALLQTGKIDDAGEILFPLVERVKENMKNCPSVLAPLLNNIGSYYFLRHDWVNSYVNYREAFLYAGSEEVDTFYYARIVYNLGNTCRLNGFYKESLEYLELAQKLFRSVFRDNDPRTIYATALSFKGLGKMDHAQKMISQAIGYFESQSNREYLQKARLQYAFDILGPTDPDTALQELDDIRKDFLHQSDHIMCLFTCAKMMMLHIKFGSVESALEIHTTSQHLLNRINKDSDYLAYWFRASASVLYQNGDLDVAMESAKRSVMLYRSFHLEKEVAASLEVLAEILEASGDFSELIDVQKQIIDALRTSRIGGS